MKNVFIGAAKYGRLVRRSQKNSIQCRQGLPQWYSSELLANRVQVGLRAFWNYMLHRVPTLQSSFN